ncbi:tryptophan halogenase family protein [Colwelliaceae bacterium BS250]
MSKQIKQVVIVGGGTAGWMSASLLAKLLGKQLNITLIESDQIGTIGVGEATIPPIATFNKVLGINEADFIKHTKATFKLGIQFENWGLPGDCYSHAFGDIGKDLGMTPFHHYYLRAKQANKNLQLSNFSLNHQAIIAQKFAHIENIANTPLSGIRHAYHFDAGLYAKYLRQYSENLGVRRIEGKILTTQLNANNGFIDSVTLENGNKISADLFIDCSGFKALLIKDALNIGYQDWSELLPMDRAWAVPSKSTTPIKPYTRSIAHESGWQWQIPLQHRTGNGLVYCSKYMDDDSAKQLLLDNLDSEAIAEPKLVKFKTGKREKLWHKNCIAIGLSSGFLEPLESTAIHLIQSSIVRLVKLFPNLDFEQTNIDEFNRQGDSEYLQIRDFIILHYRLNQKQSSPLWQHSQKMAIPDSLQKKIDLFAANGHLFKEQHDLFSEVAWLQVMLGQNLTPTSYHPVADQLSDQQLNGFLTDLSNIYKNTCAKMPSHEQFLQKIT